MFIIYPAKSYYSSICGCHSDCSLSLLHYRPSALHKAYELVKDCRQPYPRNVLHLMCVYLQQRPWDRNNAHTDLYVKQLYQLAASFNGYVIDIFQKWQAKDPNWHKIYLKPDNLHLNEAGNRAIHGEIMAALQKNIPSMLPNNMPGVFVFQPEIDLANPTIAFERAVVG